MLLARDKVLFDMPNIRERTTAMQKSEPRQAWTDEYSNIVQVMSFTKAFAID
jgi:hypothetical protein